MKIISHILLTSLFIISASSLKAMDSLGREVEQNKIYFSKHHKEDFVKHPRKGSHRKHTHKRKH